ncbi:MAG: hypothetical protein A2Y25_04265 [Candidatus Melainabacteria bacterium GWF2_37_15]|nr:MAG: hypothetical protein A2Y25_04265 [Candidatus Melainabacteria bacterium GWF2_37_15]
MKILEKNNMEEGISLRNSFIISAFGHFIAAILVWLLVKLIIFLLLMFGLNIPTIEKPEPTPQDIQFVFVKPVKPQIKQIKQNKKISSANKGGKKNAVKKLKPENPHKGESSPKNDEPDELSIPVPKIKPLSSNVGSGAQGSSGPASSDSISGDGDGTGSGRRRDGGLGNSYVINNILDNPDITPYINELQRRINWNWKPPAGNENKRVELFLRIAKDGRLVILNIKKTSLSGEMDNAALNAVKKSLPLNPLPSNYKQGYLDVVFSLDYNVVSKATH